MSFEKLIGEIQHELERVKLSSSADVRKKASIILDKIGRLGLEDAEEQANELKKQLGNDTYTKLFELLAKNDFIKALEDPRYYSKFFRTDKLIDKMVKVFREDSQNVFISIFDKLKLFLTLNQSLDQVRGPKLITVTKRLITGATDAWKITTDTISSLKKMVTETLGHYNQSCQNEQRGRMVASIISLVAEAKDVQGIVKILLNAAQVTKLHHENISGTLSMFGTSSRLVKELERIKESVITKGKKLGPGLPKLMADNIATLDDTKYPGVEEVREKLQNDDAGASNSYTCFSIFRSCKRASTIAHDEAHTAAILGELT